MARINEGEVWECEIRKARNYKNHKRYFALLKLGFDNQDSFSSFDWWREYILIKAGIFDSCKTPDGSFLYMAKSIAFNNMDDYEFNEVYRKTSQAIIDICKITEEDINNNIRLFL